MGLLDFGKRKIQEAAGNMREEVAMAQKLDVRELCNKMRRNDPLKTMPYYQALSDKTKNMSENELKRLYNEQERNNNESACKCIKTQMEKRGIQV